MTQDKPTTNQTTRLVKLHQTRLLLVKGPDASKFLQGQVTCDLRELSAPVTRIGAQCNPKGRILLSFRALQLDAETIALRIPASMLDKAKSSLGKYIVFSKAKLHDDSGYHLYGIHGDSAQHTAKTIFTILPTDNDGWAEKDGNFLIQLAQDRFECWIKSADAAAFEQQLANLTVNGDLNDWELLNIRAGVADIYPETIELFTPQEINYQLINGINFRKGCYTGQEIVARLHYRGKLKRHMYRFELSGNQLPAPGTALVNATTRNACGHLVTAAFTSNNQIEILASLLDEQLDQVTLETSTEILKQLPLPYAIPTADETTE
jgi:folate-binding protein YgfZ